MQKTEKDKMRECGQQAASKPRIVLTIPEVARELGVSRRFVELEVNRGRISVIRLSARVVRIGREEFLRYLADNTFTVMH